MSMIMNDMKQYMSTRLLICLLIGGIFFTACKKDEEGANSSTVVLEVFGPSPVLRGGEVKFIGQNLNKVQAVVLGDGSEISDIETISSEEIRIRIPQDAVPGHLILKYQGGQIQTKTPLTFSEPIAIEKVSSLTVKAGDVLTIEGEYLNLIAAVIFAKDVVVDHDDFVSQSREKIEVIVPKEAQTGKISISNGAEIPILIYSEEEIEVALPTVTSIAPNPVKPGRGLIIKGADFQLIASVLFPENIEVTEFTINESFTEIMVDVPQQAKEGHVKLITYSGVEVLSDELGLLAPEILEIMPDPVKNGSNLKIEGTNLDLVTTVLFVGDVEGEIVKQSATLIEVKVPNTALDGNVTLQTYSGKIAEAPIVLVRPTVTALTPSSLIAGEELLISGTDLDLVASVIFGGGHQVNNVKAASATTLRVDVPTAAESGEVILVTVNGTEVISTQVLTVISSNIPVITKVPATAKPGELIRIEGSKLHLVESVYFQDNVKATQYGSRSESVIEVYIPENAAKGKVKLKVVTFDGKEVESGSFTISGVDPVVDASYVFFDFDGKGSWWGSHGGVENDPNLSISGNYFRINKQLNGGWDDFFWRNSRNDFKTSNVTVAEWAIKMDVNVLGNKTQEFKFRLNGSDGDFWAIIPGMENRGGWYTITIPLTDFRDNNGTGSNILPNVQNIDQDFGLATNGAAGFVNMCIDNVRFEKIK